jgi:hypothetical protein
MAKIDLEIIKQVLTLKVPALTQDELANIVGEMRSMSDAITQDDNMAQPKKIKKKIVPVDIYLGDDTQDYVTAVLKVPETINSDELLFKCLNTASIENNDTRSTNRGKVNNIVEALDLLKNKALKPYGIQILKRPSDTNFIIEGDINIADEYKLTSEEIEQILNPPDQQEEQEQDVANVEVEEETTNNTVDENQASTFNEENNQ